jgi:sensor histidine kinase YesM
MNKKGYKLFRLYGYPSFGLLLYLIFILLNPFERTYNSWKFYVAMDFFLEFTFCTIFAAALFETGIQLNKLINMFYSWERHFLSRFTIQLVVQVSVLYLLIRLFFSIDFPSRFGYDDLLTRQTIIVGIIFTLMTTAIFAAEHFFYRWTDARLRSMEMEQLSTKAQLEALKLQLDPHFLFNNLSTVTALIDRRPDTATLYVTKLSSIYRYMLANRTQHTISLEKELEFIEAYLFLYEIRYGNSIKVNIEQRSAMARFGLPPLTLQLLIENAIKHNVFSIDSPLHIHIDFPKENLMVVENNRSPKAEKEDGTQVGIRNIQERYRLLHQPEPVIVENDHLFRVEIPLIIVE